MAFLEKKIIAIPARLESSRLPNKIIADINGKPMIRHVLEKCKKAKFVEDVVLCTDDEPLFEMALSWGYKSILTAKDFSSGSERISSVCREIIEIAWAKEDVKVNNENIKNLLEKTLIINVQGDQPLINHEIISLLAKKSQNYFDKGYGVITPVYRLSEKDIHNPAVVKTLISKDWRVLYFSRSAIPHIRDVPSKDWFKYYSYWGHVGIYGFRGDVIENWNKLKVSTLEKLEKLEQLRLLEEGYDIISFEIEEQSISVDTFEQLEEVRKLMIEKKI